MEAIRAQLSKNPLIVGVVSGGLVGLIIGLIFGWVIWPVEYSGAYPRDLIYEEKVEYLRLAIQAYGSNKDAGLARFRYQYIGEDNEKALAEIVQNPAGLAPEQILDFSSVVTSSEALITPPVAGTPQAQVTPVLPGVVTAVPEEEPERSFLTALWPVFCVLALALAGVLAWLFIQRSRQRSGGMPTTPVMQAEEARRQAAWTDYEAEGIESPIAQFMASYRIGDDLFDDSFSIDSPSGEFLGECGVGISDTIGVGDPKKVSAFEIWLFDKNDIQTITKVVMGAHAFSNLAIRQRLEAKGEPVLAEPNAEIYLETQTLQLTGKVIDMSYGQGALPEESYFESFIVELSIWPK